MKKIKWVLAAVAVLGMMLCTGCRSGENGEIYVYSYGDYFDQEAIADFEDETGIRVIQDTYDTAEEMYPVIEKGTADYDVLITSDYMIEKMIHHKMLLEVDKKNLPALKNIDSRYMKKSESFDPGNRYSVPYMVGVSGIIYNRRMDGGDVKIDSWGDLWNPEVQGQHRDAGQRPGRLHDCPASAGIRPEHLQREGNQGGSGIAEEAEAAGVQIRQ